MTILVRCADPRITPFFEKEEIAKKLDIYQKPYAVVSNTGSIKYFLATNELDKLISQLEILVHHFNADRIVLTNHTDCGFYKKLNEDKKQNYQDDLLEVKKELEKNFPDLSIDTYFIDTNKGEII